MLVLLTKYSVHHIEMRWIGREASIGETRKLNGFDEET